MQPEYFYTLATDSELNELLAGKGDGVSLHWPSYSAPPHLSAGATGVVWKRGSRDGDPVRPIVLVAYEEDFKRLCARFAQLRSDLSPLTAWCHLLTPTHFESLKSPKREADLGGMEAAWTGLVVAEALLLSEKPIRTLRFPACLATQSFAIARTNALWSDLSEIEIAKRFDRANQLFRIKGDANGGEIRTRRIRSALQPIWSSLIAASRDETSGLDRELRPIVASLKELQSAKRHKDANEAERLARPLLPLVPEARVFFELSDLPPEQRLKLFDQLMNSLNHLSTEEPSLRRTALTLLAGYLATVAAGGIPTLSLAEDNAFRWPEITAWAYAVGGIGERVVWTSSFDGLGRLVAREMMRSLDLDEPPSCDFALDEASVLVGPKLPDPLVHLRIKQGKIATVALLPGVNISISTNDAPEKEVRPQPAQSARAGDANRSGRNIFASIADALWPFLRPRVEECITWAQDNEFQSSSYERHRNKRKSSSDSQLALKGSKK